jgi:tRNA threonylcarbamoyladenosine biosynthesis protein TsaE
MARPAMPRRASTASAGCCRPTCSRTCAGSRIPNDATDPARREAMSDAPVREARRFRLGDAAATDALGAALAATRPPRATVFLQGDLGAGKSHLARAMLRALGVAGAIKSPTYTLVERYPLHDRAAAGDAAHLDLYRIADAGELDFLGLDALVEDVTLWLVEWPERGGAGLPAEDLRVGLRVDGAGREARLEAVTPVGASWLRALDESSPWPKVVTPA